MVKVFMLGWEFPPFFAGGVGTVCYELTRHLRQKGVEVTYVMPKGPVNASSKHVKLIVAEREMRRIGVTTHSISSVLTPYMAFNEQHTHQSSFSAGSLMSGNNQALYGKDLLNEIFLFAKAALELSRRESFDIIHAHDWTTIPAALAIKRETGKPFVLHAHITEFDKTGGEHADPSIYRIEHEGFHNADRIIAVSKFVKDRLVHKYFVDPAKISVVYNSVGEGTSVVNEKKFVNEDERLVLFLGRVTLQKGPDYFLEAATKVAMIMPNVRFIIAGTGDMLTPMIEKAARLGLGNKVSFTGFVNREEGDRLYRMADLFVMPSVSEPFGIVPLEAIKQGTPVIVSRQSGVSEVLRNALKVDFWDTEDLANKIIATLTYHDLHSTLRHHSEMEVRGYTWDVPAQECINIYNEILSPQVVMVRW